MGKPRVTVKPYGHSPTSKWVVDFIKNSKRNRKFFRTKKEASTFKDQILIELENLGNKAFAISDDLRMEAVQCAERLAPFKGSLTDAVDFYLAHLEASRKSCTIAELVQDYLASKSRSQKRKRHLDDLKSRLRRFNEHFAQQVASCVKAKDIELWIHGLGVEPQTMNNYRTIVSGLFAYAMKHGFVNENPVTKIEKVKVPSKDIAILTPTQLRKLFASADQRIHAYIAIAAFAGLRIAELDKLHWDNVNLESGLIEVTAGNSKTSSRRHVTIQPNLQAWLFQFPDRIGSVKPKNLRRLLDAAWSSLELGRSRSNDFRHSFASYHYAMFGNPEQTAMELGHSDTSMLYKHYRELVTKTEAESYWDITKSSEKLKLAIPDS